MELTQSSQPVFPNSKQCHQLYTTKSCLPTIHANKFFQMDSIRSSNSSSNSNSNSNSNSDNNNNNGNYISQCLSVIKKRLLIGKNEQSKLFGYQLRTLCWMYLVEIKISQKQKFIIGNNDMRFTNDPNVKCKVLFDYINEKFLRHR